MRVFTPYHASPTLLIPQVLARATHYQATGTRLDDCTACQLACRDLAHDALIPKRLAVALRENRERALK